MNASILVSTNCSKNLRPLLQHEEEAPSKSFPFNEIPCLNVCANPAVSSQLSANIYVTTQLQTEARSIVYSQGCYVCRCRRKSRFFSIVGFLENHPSGRCSPRVDQSVFEISTPRQSNQYERLHQFLIFFSFSFDFISSNNFCTYIASLQSYMFLHSQIVYQLI